MESSSRRIRVTGTKTEQQPRISILMAMWNAERYLAEAIQSVLAQDTLTPWELLLIDDGSQDTSLRIALDFAEHEPDRIRILRHPGGENRGRSASRNLGLRHARGSLIAFLDADDVWLPGNLSTQVSVLADHPEASMVYGAAERWCDLDRSFDDIAAREAWWGENYIPPTVPVGTSLGVLPLGALLDWYLQDEAMVPCICSVLLRADAMRSVGGFDEQFHGLYDDQALHAKIALAFPVVAHDACLARYRQHAGSCCAEGRDDAATQQVARERFLHWLARYRKTLPRFVPQPAVEQPQAG